MTNIGVWKSGSIEQNIFPSEEAVSKLIDILMNNPDIVWGPDLEVNVLVPEELEHKNQIN